MITVTVKKDTHNDRWLVVVAGLDIHFEREKDARLYAAQLQSRIFAPHRLPQDKLSGLDPNWRP